MKNSEGKKQGFVSKLKDALFGEMDRAYERDLQTSRQEAQIWCERLSSWGVKANIMGEQGPTVIIEIADSPIQRVHVSHYTSAEPDTGLQTVHSHCFIVPDLRHLPKLDIKAFPVRSRSHGWIKVVYGKLIDIRWKGNDRGTGISLDPEIKGAIMSLINELGNAFYTEIYFMKIQTRLDTSGWVVHLQYGLPYKEEPWRGYESIATRLLALDIPK